MSPDFEPRVGERLRVVLEGEVTGSEANSFVLGGNFVNRIYPAAEHVIWIERLDQEIGNAARNWVPTRSTLSVENTPAPRSIGGKTWALTDVCPCGHEVSWHGDTGCMAREKDDAGCKYCTCPTPRGDFTGGHP
jgi:hypothetical protein